VRELPLTLSFNAGSDNSTVRVIFRKTVLIKYYQVILQPSISSSCHFSGDQLPLQSPNFFPNQNVKGLSCLHYSASVGRMQNYLGNRNIDTIKKTLFLNWETKFININIAGLGTYVVHLVYES